MYFSTSFSDVKSTPLHCQIPINMIVQIVRDIWLSLSIHVAELFSHCFNSLVFHSIDKIVLGPICRLRKVFTMRNRLKDFGGISDSFVINREDYLPQEYMFAFGVKSAIQVVDMAALKMSISSIARSSNDTQQNNLKIQKIKMNKLESRQVHVAFGSRIPLPLATVKINMNIPGENKSHYNESEHIEAIGRTTQFQCEISFAKSKRIQIGKNNERKVETLNNLLKHANTFNKKHALLKLKRSQLPLDQRELPTIDEFTKKSETSQFITHELQLPSNEMITNDINHKSSAKNLEDENININSSHDFSKNSNKNCNCHDSFELSDTIKFTNNLHPKPSPNLDESQLKTLYKNIKASTFGKDILYRMNLPSPLECLDSKNKHEGSLLTLNNKQKDLRQVKISSSILQHEGTCFIANNARHDDLDLLYDPTLDCYYDPKTNRYCELK